MNGAINEIMQCLDISIEDRFQTIRKKINQMLQLKMQKQLAMRRFLQELSNFTSDLALNQNFFYKYNKDI